MGYNHVSSGLVAGLATLPLVPWTSGLAQASWVVGVGGASLVPDWDSAQATASRMWGPITGALSRLVATVARGHRQGTHDAVLAPVAFGGLTAAASLHPLTLGVVLALVIGLALRGLTLAGAGRLAAPLNLLVSVAGSWWLTTSGTAALGWLPLLVAAGVLVHIAGDLLTTEGVPVPLLWLFGHDRRISAGLLSTDSPIERCVVAPLLSLLGVWLLAHHAGVHDLTSAAALLGDAVSLLPGL